MLYEWPPDWAAEARAAAALNAECGPPTATALASWRPRRPVAGPRRRPRHAACWSSMAVDQQPRDCCTCGSDQVLVVAGRTNGHAHRSPGHMWPPLVACTRPPPDSSRARTRRSERASGLSQRCTRRFRRKPGRRHPGAVGSPFRTRELARAAQRRSGAERALTRVVGRRWALGGLDRLDQLALWLHDLRAAVRPPASLHPDRAAKRLRGDCPWCSLVTCHATKVRARPLRRVSGQSLEQCKAVGEATRRTTSAHGYFGC